MSGVTRREFFTKSVLGFMEDMQSALGQVNGKIREYRQTSDWICLGRVQEFPFGMAKACDGAKVTVTVASEGIYAVDGEGQFKPLEIRSGMLWTNLAGQWPEGSMVSIMTGERISQIDQGRAT